ncbi:peptidoglycan DD-metalloendopeptidase family protein, partial [Candidatus Jorgensenbacteria bacterium]|nr:peptidoglycan DD-metalloendopeptidase family protein [Candidatus Jorgensenbacteria bacterium]
LRGLQAEFKDKLVEGQNKKREREIEQGSLLNRQDIVVDQKEEKKKLLSQTNNQEKIYQQQVADLDKKQEEISKTIETFEDQLRTSFDPSLLPIKRPGVFNFPVIDPVITQYYGPTKFAERAYRTKIHTGVDFRARVGTPIFAALDGKIVTVDNNDRGVSRWNRYQYGRYIVIEHDNNLSTLYAHLSRTVVKKGDAVQRGALIGYSGNSGYTFGPHLHMGLFWTPSIQFRRVPPAQGFVPIGVTIDIKDYLPPLPIAVTNAM